MHVLGLAVELNQLATKIGANTRHGVLAEVQHRRVENPATIFRYEYRVYPQRRDAVGATPVGVAACGNRDVGGVFYSRGVHTEGVYPPAPTTPVGGGDGAHGEREPRARERPKDAPTHVRSWPLRPDPSQCRVIRTRFFAGARVYNAVLAEFIGCSRAVRSDPAWQVACQLPRRTNKERAARRAALDAVAAVHGFSDREAQSFASSVRQSWVREHVPAQEAQNLGARAFDAVKRWHVGRKGKPRFKNQKRGLHSLAAKDGNGALRPKMDAAGRLVGLQWGAGFVVATAAAAQTGRRGKEQRAELAEIEALISAGKVLSTPIVRTVINGRDTYRMQMVCDGHPTRRHRVGDGRVSFDLGPSQIAVAIEGSDGAWVDGFSRWPIGSG